MEIIGNSLVLTLGQLLPPRRCEVFIPEEAIRQAEHGIRWPMIVPLPSTRVWSLTKRHLI